jgi:DNA modification methylase
MTALGEDSVDLVVTSPPYPMIAMWDGIFAAMNPEVADRLEGGDGRGAFELMHEELDKVWRECFRVLGPGRIACINIGDAVRTIAGDFQMYPNHARITSSMMEAGFTPLPDIVWRKPTNSPTKFMGSGMLPAGAYVTYEHEYVLVFRKGGKRSFAGEAAKESRRESAFFWEERNKWFSDVWTDLVGTTQDVREEGVRVRSGAFPFELAFRLISMYSVYDDTVLDPFLGTGTTLAAAIAAARNGIGVETDTGMSEIIERVIEDGLVSGKARVRDRLRGHVHFVRSRQASGAEMRYLSKEYDFPVMSSQEEEIVFYEPLRLTRTDPGRLRAEHAAVGKDSLSEFVDPVTRSDPAPLR